MNFIFPFLIVSSIVCAFFCGNVETAVTDGINAAENAIQSVIAFAGIMSFWSGILRVAENSGMLSKLERCIYPMTKLLFPKLEKGSKALEKIISNIAANMLGTGNAATPAGISAMACLDKINPNPEKPTDEMCIFAVLNTASVQLVPTTVISFRAAAGSKAPAAVVLPVLLCSVCSLAAALFSMKLILKAEKRRKK